MVKVLLSDRRAHDYTSWRSVVFAINNVCVESGHSDADRDDLIHAFSQRDPIKYDPTRVSQYIRSLVPNKAGNRFGTLGAMAKEDSPSGWRDLQENLHVYDAIVDTEVGRESGAGGGAHKPHHHPVNPEDVRSVASALVNFLNMDPNNTEVVSACVCERRCCDDGNKHAAKLLQLDVQTRVCTWVQ